MIGNILKQLRTENGLTIAKAAETFGVATRTYSSYELEEREPNLALLNKLADFYNVSTDYLLGRTPVRAMNTLPVGALSEEEVKDIDAAIVTGYTQLSLETRRAFIAMLEELFGNIFEREDFGEEEPPQDSTA